MTEGQDQDLDVEEEAEVVRLTLRARALDERPWSGDIEEAEEVDDDG
jgi:hypothetical protein